LLNGYYAAFFVGIFQAMAYVLPIVLFLALLITAGGMVFGNQVMGK
jgi:hypothetical protein